MNYKRWGEAARVHHWDARTSQPHKNSANSKLARITSMRKLSPDCERNIMHMIELNILAIHLIKEVTAKVKI